MFTSGTKFKTAPISPIIKINNVLVPSFRIKIDAKKSMINKILNKDWSGPGLEGSEGNCTRAGSGPIYLVFTRLTLVLAMCLDVPTSSCISQLSPGSCLQSSKCPRPLQCCSLFPEVSSSVYVLTWILNLSCGSLSLIPRPGQEAFVVCNSPLPIPTSSHCYLGSFRVES